MFNEVIKCTNDAMGLTVGKWYKLISHKGTWFEVVNDRGVYGMYNIKSFK